MSRLAVSTPVSPEILLIVFTKNRLELAVLMFI